MITNCLTSLLGLPSFSQSPIYLNEFGSQVTITFFSNPPMFRQFHYTQRILPISWTHNSLNAFLPMALLFILLQPLKTWVIFCHCHLWHSFYSLHFKPPTLWPSFPSPGNLPNSGIKSVISCIVGRFFTAEPSGKPSLKHLLNQNFSPNTHPKLLMPTS